VPVQKLADISRSPLCCRAPIANPPNSAQLGITPTILPSYIRVRAVVRECSEGQTDAHTAVTTIHFASSTTDAKCNKRQVGHQLYDLLFKALALIFVQPDDKTQKIRLPFCYIGLFLPNLFSTEYLPGYCGPSGRYISLSAAFGR